MELHPGIRNRLTVFIRPRRESRLSLFREQAFLFQYVQCQLIGISGMNHHRHLMSHADPKLLPEQLNLFFFRVLAIMKIQPDFSQRLHFTMCQHLFNACQILLRVFRRMLRMDAHRRIAPGIRFRILNGLPGRCPRVACVDDDSHIRCDDFFRPLRPLFLVKALKIQMCMCVEYHIPPHVEKKGSRDACSQDPFSLLCDIYFLFFVATFS